MSYSALKLLYHALIIYVCRLVCLTQFQIAFACLTQFQIAFTIFTSYHNVVAFIVLPH